MSARVNTSSRRSMPRINRRAFLWGVGGVSIGLPFLEGAPERSAWAADEEPVFALFMGTSNGIIVDQFWPAEFGSLQELATEPNATGILGDFAERLLFVRGLRYPQAATNETHGQSYPQMLTGAPYATGTPLANASAPSIDVILAPLLNPDGADPLTLYAGMKQNYIDEAMSWGEDGTRRPAEGNPFVVYTQLLDGAELGLEPGVLEHAVLVRRKSALDLARDELVRFQARSATSAKDRQRLEHHLDALRAIEQSLADLETSMCSVDLLDASAILAVKETYGANGMIEDVCKLQLDLTAFAFACNLNHVATLQSGAGLDQTRYDVPSNERGWTFHHISHQIQSDATVGTDALAVQAHSEIDRLRMETLAHGIRQFDAHALLDKALLFWTNQFSNGTYGDFSDLPLILAGNPYARLRSGQYVTHVGHHNSELLTTVAHALGIQRTIGTATGPLEDLLA